MTKPVTATENWIVSEEGANVSATAGQASPCSESTLLPEGGWRAEAPGTRTLRVAFPQPRPIRRIQLVFSELERERTQQFVLQWAPAAGGPWTKIVQQQWNFSPNGSTRETEDYNLNLEGVLVLELTVTPDIKGGSAIASLDRLLVS